MPRQFKITVNGIDYQVAVEELGTQSAPAQFAASVAAAPVVNVAPPPSAAPAPAAKAAASAGDETAQMGGVVAQIYVKQGQSITEGTRLLDLEAMKMKVPVIATRSGKVTRILVAEGDAVDSGQALISIS